MLTRKGIVLIISGAYALYASPQTLKDLGFGEYSYSPTIGGVKTDVGTPPKKILDQVCSFKRPGQNKKHVYIYTRAVCNT